MEKYNRFSELLWLFLTIMSFCMVVYMMIIEGTVHKSKWHLFVPLLAAAMYLGRRMIRKRLEKTKAEMQNQKKKN